MPRDSRRSMKRRRSLLVRPRPDLVLPMQTTVMDREFSALGVCARYDRPYAETAQN